MNHDRLLSSLAERYNIAGSKRDREAYLYLADLLTTRIPETPTISVLGCFYDDINEDYEINIVARCRACEREIAFYTMQNLGNKLDTFLVKGFEGSYCPYCGQATDFASVRKLFTPKFYERAKKEYIQTVYKERAKMQKKKGGKG